ncbi:MAG: S-layer homology domain-containing protein [Clostridiales bacterium]|nr:S-layer homology domain-containing protein [Clostridiales bacterium]
MRRIMSIILALMLTISSLTTVAFADSWKSESGNNGLVKKGGLPPGIAKKLFVDIDNYKWAKDAIEKMAEKGVIMGIGQGMFAPQKAETKLEAIVMLLRVMGEENIAARLMEDIKAGKKKFELKGKLQDWAYGYVALAEEKGLLDEADLLYFKLNDAATRHEVAKYIVRAMGNEDEAQDHMNANLGYKDDAFIPQGSVGYIYVAQKEGILKGYEDDTFRPFNLVTRAEMAVMISRLDDNKSDDAEYDIYKGDVTGRDKDYEWLKIEDKKFYITDDTKIVFNNDENGSVQDIKIGDYVKAHVNSDNEIIYIKVYSDLSDRYSGRITDIDETGSIDWIKIKIGTDERRFEISEDAEVVFIDKDGELEDLAIGDKVEIKLNDDKEIRYIEVDRELGISEYNGSIALVDGYDLILFVSDKFIELSMDKNTEVVFDDDEGAIGDLRIGNKAEVTVKDHKITKIIVDGDIDESIVSGILFDIYSAENRIAVRDNENTHIDLYTLDTDAVIYLNNNKVRLSSLKKDDYLGMEIDNNKVVKIYAFRD